MQENVLKWLENIFLYQWFSAFVGQQPSQFFLYNMKAWYNWCQAMAQQLRNTDLPSLQMGLDILKWEKKKYSEIKEVNVSITQGYIIPLTSSVAYWSEFLATDSEVLGSIPGATRFPEN
jgi:hypothetical protein